MKLFDEMDRQRTSGKVRGPKPAFDFVNHNPWRDTSDIRRTCESWFQRYPVEHQAELRERFRSRDDDQHSGAFFELLLHELFLRLGCSVDVNPNLSGLTPDFRVTQGGESIYVEATAVGRQSDPFFRNHNELDVIDKLNGLSSPNFYIGVDMEGHLKKMLSRGYVTGRFKRLLEAHDSKEVQGLIDQLGRQGAPSEKIECGDWTLTGHLVPRSQDRPFGDSARPIVMDGYAAKRVDPVTSVREALREKASTYRSLKIPLVIAVNAINPFYAPPESDIDVLWGDLRVSYGREPDSPLQYTRRLNGFWSPGHTGEADAVLICKHADMLNMFQVSGCLYIDPRSNPPKLLDLVSQLPSCRVVETGADREAIRTYGEDIAKLLGVSIR